MNINDIVQKIADGELTRDIDESGAGGFWDYSNELIYSCSDLPTPEIHHELQENIYNALWELYETLAMF